MTNKKPVSPSNTGVSRRNLLGVAAAAPLGAVVAKATQASAASPQDHIDLSKSYPFYGQGPQAGIQTAPQRYSQFMAFNLTSLNPRDIQILLARWSAAIAQMMAGKPVGLVDPERDNAVVLETGEALDLGPASLTVTVGLGPKVFSDVKGLEDYKPPLMRSLHDLPGDALKAELSGGDLAVQACADDPQVTYHAVRILARIAKAAGVASTRWAIMGFGRASAGPGQTTPRNLLGFRDGTRNITTQEDYDRFVWIKDGPQWQHNGSYMVSRKIRMFIESWDTDRVDDQNDVFGRFKVSGAPLSGEHEFDEPDFEALKKNGDTVIPKTSHMSLAAHENMGGLKLLRRSYNYTDGINQVGMLDAGLHFVSYQNDPAIFEAMQSRLGSLDRLNEYISHIGSAIFFAPPAPQKGSYIGAYMFA